MLIPYGLGLWLGLIGIASGVTQLRLRALRWRAVLHTLATIVGQNLPLVTALRAAALAEHGKMRWIYATLADRLEVGDALSTALRHAVRSCPGHVIGAIQAAERGGTLPSVLRSLAADRDEVPNQSSAVAPTITYFFVMGIVVPAITLAIIIFLIPQLRDIFQDFGIQSLPPLTERLINISDVVVDNLFWFLLAALVFFIVSMQYLLGRHFLVRAPERTSKLAAAFDSLVWRLPVVGRVAETRALARQLPVLLAGVRAGHDLGEAARQAACVGANHRARRRLLGWADKIEHGTPPDDAAQQLGFPRALRAAVGRGAGPEQLGTALEYLAAYYRSLRTHWDLVLGSLLVPLTVLVWALVVGTVVVGLHLPMEQLRNSVMDNIY